MSTFTRSTASTPRPRLRRRWRRCMMGSRPARPATSAPPVWPRGGSPERNGWTPFISMQDQYNLIDRGEELEMFGLLADQGVGSIPWSPLAQGVVPPPWATGPRTGAPGHGPLRPTLWLDSDQAIIDA